MRRSVAGMGRAVVPLLMVIYLPFGASGNAIAEGRESKFSLEHVQCLIENLDAARQIRERPRVVVLSRCPDFESFGFTFVPDVVVNNGNTVRNVISLSDNEIDCLRQKSQSIRAMRGDVVSAKELGCLE